MRININEFAHIPFSDKIAELEDSFNMKVDELATLVGVTARTILNYREKGQGVERETPGFHRIELLYGVRKSIALHVKGSVEIRRILDDKSPELDNQSLLDLIRSVQTRAPVVIYAINFALKAKLEMSYTQKSSPLDEFRSIYEHFNEETLKKAAIESPELVEAIAVNASLRPLTRALSVEALHYAKNPRFLTVLTLSASKDPSPLVREGAINGLLSYCSDHADERKSVLSFLESRIPEEGYEGVTTTIRSAVKEITSMIRYGDADASA